MPPSKNADAGRLRKALQQFRYSLSFVDALPQLTLLGFIVGVCTGLIIVVFRLLIEVPLNLLLPAGADSFEALDPPLRVALIVGGLLATYLLLVLCGRSAAQVSVGHVLDRLHNHQGFMPIRNWVVQFVGGVFCLVSGQSVGREGPAVHLGAGVASHLSQALRLPNNSRYSLIACGVAAAISASFDTPMAGVIFAMEVILMEYTIAGFVPVILASVTATVISQAVFGSAAPLLTHGNDLSRLQELPFMGLVGLTLACAAALFIRLHTRFIQLSHWPLWLRLSLAGLLTSIAAWFVPQIMGLGYDTLNQAVAGELSASALITIALVKLVVTAAILGLGVPGGIIGPTLLVGACLGGALGLTAQWVYGGHSTDAGFYVIIGMTGMMAAVLNAPLAALVAVLELSYNPHMIFPSMLVIVIACVTTRFVFNLEGVFIEQLKLTGRPLQFRPTQRLLMHAGVGAVMTKAVTYSYRQLDYEQAKRLLTSQPEWIVVDADEESERDKVALRAADLATYLQEAPVAVLSLSEEIDLLEIAGRRLVLQPIHDTATLWEALEALRATQADALYVSRHNSPAVVTVTGLVTRDAIDNYYQV